MILIDFNEENKTKRDASLDLMRHIRALKVPVEKTGLSFGDAAFEGRGPDNSVVTIGIERKGLHDMLNCIEDSRYTGHQLPGMKMLYSHSVLIIEGHWKPHDPGGFLMEGFSGGTAWGFLKHRKQNTLYSMLYRYLISVQLAGVTVTYSRDPFHTAFNICEWFHYFQKNWDGHRSLMEMQKLALPTLTGKPTLVRKWSAALTNIGATLSGAFDKKYKRAIDLAMTDESELLTIPGVGVKTAQAIVKEIRGGR